MKREPDIDDDNYGDDYEPYVLREVTTGNTTVRLWSADYGFLLEFVNSHPLDRRGFKMLLDGYEHSALCDLFCRRLPKVNE